MTLPEHIQNNTPETSLHIQDGRTTKGRFAPGVSGNPKGKPKGTRSHATRAALALMEGQLEHITQALVDAAVNGDLSAIRLVLDRLVPVAKERPLTDVDLPMVASTADLPAVTAAILNAVATGQITPGEGQSLTALVSAYGKAVEVADLEKRITALEQLQGKGAWK